MGDIAIDADFSASVPLIHSSRCQRPRNDKGGEKWLNGEGIAIDADFSASVPLIHSSRCQRPRNDKGGGKWLNEEGTGIKHIP